MLAVLSNSLLPQDGSRKMARIVFARTAGAKSDFWAKRDNLDRTIVAHADYRRCGVLARYRHSQHFGAPPTDLAICFCSSDSWWAKRPYHTHLDQFDVPALHVELV